MVGMKGIKVLEKVKKGDQKIHGYL